MAIALRRFTTTGGPNVIVMDVLKNIVVHTAHATAALLDHSTLFQAVEEALQRGTLRGPLRRPLEDIKQVRTPGALH
eukprot:11498288-Heterocapsa_arctica.AAC.1